MTIPSELDKATAARLRCMLDEQGGSLSAFVRAAILEKLGREGKKSDALRAWQALVWPFKSGKGDLALNHQEVLQGSDACQASPLALAL